MGVDPQIWQALATQLARALRQKGARGAAQLRPLVFRVVTGLRTVGEPWERVETIVLRALSDHPELGEFDRLDVVSGKPSSDALRDWMVGWVHSARQVEEPTAARTGVKGSRINVQKAETVLERLAPVFERQLDDARQLTPGAGQDELLDRALQKAVMDLRFALNRQTFEYLRWRVERLALATGVAPARLRPGESP